MADIEMVEATFPVARVADSARGYPRDSNNIMEVQAGSGIRNSGSDDIASSSAKAGPETAKKDATSSSTVELQADSDVTPGLYLRATVMSH